MKIYDGTRFGRWVVLGEGPRDAANNRTQECRCDCGNTRAVAVGSLTSGRSTSCGCLSAELSSTRRSKHKKSKSSTYVVWLGMKARCMDEGHEAFHRYGGRGIKVCERWMAFENFLADMGERPIGMSIERKNNAGNYEPGNCKWATPQEQANNRRSNRIFTVNDEALNLTQLSKKYAVPYAKLRSRLLYLGWTVERAISTP